MTSNPKPRPACSIPGCESVSLSRSFCNRHYRMFRLRPVPRIVGCIVEGCDRPHSAYGLCGMHASRAVRGGLKGRKPRGVGCTTDGHEAAKHYSNGLCRSCYDKARYARLAAVAEDAA
jgi:hypothetical protein